MKRERSAEYSLQVHPCPLPVPGSSSSLLTMSHAESNRLSLQGGFQRNPRRRGDGERPGAYPVSVEGREPGLCQGRLGLLFKAHMGRVKQLPEEETCNWSHWADPPQVPLPRFTLQLWCQVKACFQAGDKSCSA